MTTHARSNGQAVEGERDETTRGLRSTGVVCLAAARITLLVAVAVALMGVGILFGEPSLATAATGQAAFTLTNGVQSYDDTTPGGMALKELFKATSIVVQSGEANGLTNLPISLTYGGKPLTGTAALSLTGTFEDATGLLQGTYYYEYDIVYNSAWFGTERQVGAYNGTVEAALGADAKTASLFFKGSWTVTHYTPAPGGGWQEASPSWGSDARHVTFTLTGIVPEHGTVLGGFRGTGQDKGLARWRHHVD